tara:strand:- start:224 stop:385 length:162 start_codon:yes stop_codon:yes gene_type:complete
MLRFWRRPNALDSISAKPPKRARIWKEENAGAIADLKVFIDAQGVPLAEYRKF